MKNTLPVITILFIGALSMGCDKEQASASRKIDALKVETAQAEQDINNYTYAQKAEFSAKMKSQLAEINRDLDQLSARIEGSSDSIKAEAKPKLEALREQTALLNKQLGAVENATESTWDSVKSGTSKAYEAVKEGFQQSRQWVSDKIAP